MSLTRNHLHHETCRKTAMVDYYLLLIQIFVAILDEQFYVSDFCRYVPKNEPKVDYFYKHIGIYGFKTEVLNQLLDLEPTKNELERQLEQMRWLDNHFKIKAGITAFESISIDTPNDVEKAILHYNQLT